jgi:predicted esterase
VATCIATADWLKPASIYRLSAPNPVIQAQYERYNPLTNLERYRRGAAISFQCSASDPVVPADGAQRFVQALADAYARCPEKLEVVVEDAAGHQLTETMWRNALAWFAKYL